MSHVHEIHVLRSDKIEECLPLGADRLTDRQHWPWQYPSPWGGKGYQYYKLTDLGSLLKDHLGLWPQIHKFSSLVMFCQEVLGCGWLSAQGYSALLTLDNAMNTRENLTQISPNLRHSSGQLEDCHNGQVGLSTEIFYEIYEILGHHVHPK